MKNILQKKIIIILYIFLPYTLFSESVYKLDLKTELMIGTVTASLFTANFFINSDPRDIKSKDNINFFDKQFIYPYNKTADKISTIGAATVLVLPVFSVFENKKDLKFLGTYGVMYAEAFLLTMATKDFFKQIVSRNRPYVYEGHIPAGKEDEYYHSFPSGHTSYAFLGATFLAATFSKEYHDSKWKLPLVISSYSIAATVGTLRIASGSHFATDVLAGAFIGSFYGWFIPYLHFKPGSSESEIVVIPAGNSLRFSVLF